MYFSTSVKDLYCTITLQHLCPPKQSEVILWISSTSKTGGIITAACSESTSVTGLESFSELFFTACHTSSFSHPAVFICAFTVYYQNKAPKDPPSQADDSVTLGDINPADEEAENNTTRAQQRRSILYILQQLLFHINFVVLLHLSVLSDWKL